MARLLDHRGNPIDLSRLTEELAAPAFGSVTSVWTETVLAGLTPKALAEILRAAANGYPDRFFDLASEMEERDLHYGSVLGTRKMAITGVEPIVVAADKTARAGEIAEAVRELVTDPSFQDDYIADLLDGLGKGYAVVETVWDRSGRRWTPAGYEWRDQKFFQLDRINGRTLRLKTPGSLEGAALEPFKFSVHEPKRKSGLSVRGGLARLAAWAFLFKHYTLKDWMAFLEVYGMPFRVGRYGRGASTDDKRVLLRAVRELSSDAAAIIPKDMEIEFIEAAGGAGNAVFSSKAEYLDRQISKGVLGQTMTTDDGSSLSQAKIHESVRHDIARADARQVCVTANRDLVRPFVDLNFGPQEKYPVVVIPITESEDIKILAEVVDTAVQLGVEIDAAEFRERIGFGEPPEGARLLVPGARLAQPDPVDPDQGEKAKARVCPSCGGVHALASDHRDELDLLVEDGLAAWERDGEAVMAPLRKLFAGARSYDELIEGLEDLAAKMDMGPLADRLAKLAMKARGLGDTGEGRGDGRDA